MPEVQLQLLACARTAHARASTRRPLAHGHTRALQVGYVGKNKQRSRQQGGGMPMPHNAFPQPRQRALTPSETLFFQVRAQQQCVRVRVCCCPRCCALLRPQHTLASPHLAPPCTRACRARHTCTPHRCPCPPASQLKEFEEFRHPSFNVLYVQTPRPELIMRPFTALMQARAHARTHASHASVAHSLCAQPTRCPRALADVRGCAGARAARPSHAALPSSCAVVLLLRALRAAGAEGHGGAAAPHPQAGHPREQPA